MGDSPRSITLLHVDDEPDLAEMAAEFLTRVDDSISVDIATTASDGINKFAENSYDCIVSDYDMPGRNGIEFLEVIREDNPDLPFILYTGKGSEEVASEAISAGVTDYLQKASGTSHYEVLANRIRNAVERHWAGEKARETEAWADTLLEYSSDFLFVINENSVVSYVSLSVERVLGFQPTDITGTSAFDFVSSEDVEQASKTFEELLETPGEEFTTEIRAEDADGESRWLEVRGRNLLQDPIIDGILVNARDITERKARESELKRFRQAAEYAGHAIYITDPDGTIEYVNPAFEEITGYPADEVIGRTPRILNSGEMEAEYYDDLWETILAGERWEEEIINRRKSGNLYRAYQTIAPITDDTGEPSAFVAIQTDISDRMEREDELRRERSRLEALFQNSIDAIAFTEFVDGEPIVRDVNATFEETFGYDRESAIGRPIDELVVPDEAAKQQEAEDLNRLIEAGERVLTEVRRQTAEGVRDFLLQSTPLEPGEHSRYSYAIYSDISERKEREMKLQRKNERLEEFASVVSHDLRNPLNVADGKLQLAIEQRDWAELDGVAQALDRMESLIEDMLSLANAGEAVGEPETVELAELMESCWQNVETESASLRIETETSIQADKSRLRQLIENLLRNAVEHGGSDVAVTVGELPEGFYLEDDGPGLPEEERQEVLEPGYTTSETGTGFGLSIVRDIAHAHGWELRIADGEAGGARFEFTGVETA